MSKTRSEASSAAAAMQTIASDGYLAFIEWPVFLVNRLKQVQQHLTVTAPHDAPVEPAAANVAVQGKTSGQHDIAIASLPTAPVPQAGRTSSSKAILADKGMPVSATIDGAEGDLLRLLDGFTMQGEEE